METDVTCPVLLLHSREVGEVPPLDGLPSGLRWAADVEAMRSAELLQLLQRADLRRCDIAIVHKVFERCITLTYSFLRIPLTGRPCASDGRADDTTTLMRPMLDLEEKHIHLMIYIKTRVSSLETNLLRAYASHNEDSP